MKNINTSVNSTSAKAITSFRGKYAFLSNMFDCPVTIGGLTFGSAEAAFQAQKTLSLAERQSFCALNGQGAKKLGRKVALRPDWEQNKLSIMHDVVLAKFVQNPELGKALRDTGDVELVEGNTWNDTFWGVDSRAGGENHLGKILMAVRSQLVGELASDYVRDAESLQLAAEGSRLERERIAKWKAEHGEAVNGTAQAVVDNTVVNAPATTNAVRLDAEREDSKFDGRRQDEVFGSMTEAEAYEVTDSLLDEDKIDLSGYHKAKLIGWESIRGCKKTVKDGSIREYKPYVALTFVTESGEELTSRAYVKQYGSFKIQANYRYKKLFTYTKDSVALNSLVGKTFDIWVHFNDLLGKNGEWQADFYDKAAYAARKSEEAAVGRVGSGNHRPTEDKACK